MKILISVSAKQKVSDATVKLVAAAFPTQIATLAQLDKKQLNTALGGAHFGFGSSVRGFIKTKTKESKEITGNPYLMDTVWMDVVQRAIDMKLYKDSDVNIYDLSGLTGNKVKESNLSLFSSADELKKVATKLRTAMKKSFGEGFTISKANLKIPFSPSLNVAKHKYNKLEIAFPMNAVLTGSKHQNIDLYLGKGIMFIVEGGSAKGVKKVIKEHKLVKGTAAEVVETFINNVKIKTNTVERPKVGKANPAAQFVIDTYGKDLKAKGIEVIPVLGGVSFYHPRRGSVKANFKMQGTVPMYAYTFKSSFGESFPQKKKITAKLIDTLVKPLLK